ncbi:hypothetical protein KC723_00675 [Candidatus Kaiserbacteria bacterium]|nr:hypothetical protein [Candidatus Kaiserbacteria bacterium]
MSVVHVVVQKETIRNNKLVLSEIANLEAEYISAQHVVSERIAKQSDLTEQSDKIFVSRSAPSLVMSPRDGG